MSFPHSENAQSYSRNQRLACSAAGRNVALVCPTFLMFKPKLLASVYIVPRHLSLLP